MVHVNERPLLVVVLSRLGGQDRVYDVADLASDFDDRFAWRRKNDLVQHGRAQRESCVVVCSISSEFGWVIFNHGDIPIWHFLSFVYVVLEHRPSPAALAAHTGWLVRKQCRPAVRASWPGLSHVSLDMLDLTPAQCCAVKRRFFLFFFRRA